MNFKNWLLLTEDIAKFDNIPPENLLAYMRDNLENGKERSEKLIEFAKTATTKDLYYMLVNRRSEDFFIKYKEIVSNKTTTKQQHDDHYKVAEDVKNYAISKYNEIIKVEEWNEGSNGFIFLTIREKQKKGNQKIYVNMPLTHKNTSIVLKKLIDYFVENIENFRQAKFPIVASREEAFIFYLSKESEDQKEKIDSDVSSILKQNGIEHTNATFVGQDTKMPYGGSFNDRKACHVTFSAIASIVGKERIQQLVDYVKKGVFKYEGLTRTPEASGGVRSVLQNWRDEFEILLDEFKSSKQISNLLKRMGVVVDGETPPKDKPSETPSDKLKLISLENNKEHVVDKRDEFGQRNLTDLLPMSVKFYASSQFRLEKIQTNWIITQIVGAKNMTNLNGIPLKPVERKTLKDGDVISIGKTQQGKLQVKL